MKNILSKTKTVVVLLVVTLLFLACYTYMLARPISYGMSYHNESNYNGVTFEGTLKFYSNGRVLNDNTNFDEPFEDYYYYKDGYVFTLMATNEQEYEAEVAEINADFAKALDTPFYAARINAFRQVMVGPDNYSATYTCTGAIVLAVLGGALEAALLGLTFASIVIRHKARG